jgi:hypothetical protein
LRRCGGRKRWQPQVNGEHGASSSVWPRRCMRARIAVAAAACTRTGGRVGAAAAACVCACALACSCPLRPRVARRSISAATSSTDLVCTILMLGTISPAGVSTCSAPSPPPPHALTLRPRLHEGSGRRAAGTRNGGGGEARWVSAAPCVAGERRARRLNRRAGGATGGCAAAAAAGGKVALRWRCCGPRGKSRSAPAPTPHHRSPRSRQRQPASQPASQARRKLWPRTIGSARGWQANARWPIYPPSCHAGAPLTAPSASLTVAFKIG